MTKHPKAIAYLNQLNCLLKKACFSWHYFKSQKSFDSRMCGDTPLSYNCWVCWVKKLWKASLIQVCKSSNCTELIVARMLSRKNLIKEERQKNKSNDLFSSTQTIYLTLILIADVSFFSAFWSKCKRSGFFLNKCSCVFRFVCWFNNIKGHTQLASCGCLNYFSQKNFDLIRIFAINHCCSNSTILIHCKS